MHRSTPGPVEAAVEAQQPAAGFALVLANGRRIENAWRFPETHLRRLRLAEA